jgi:hypothetical protein
VFSKNNETARLTLLDTGKKELLKDNEIASGIEYGNDNWVFREFNEHVTLINVKNSVSGISCRASKKKKAK